jgi:16S rRNA (adenine1518-N6/adenine1519-N6)-dimethyltransferase
MDGHRARRRFSQNFLHDPAAIARILAAIAPRPGERIFEIGPGLGAITAPLVAAAGRITAVEIDRDLAARLRERFPADRLELVEGDALALDWQRLLAGGDARIVGNLPYNVSTPLLFALVPVAHLVRDQYFMLQREVVDRMVAPPGGREYGRLSVMLQQRYRLQRLFHVAPGCFSPAPAVHSSIVRMIPRPLAELPAVDSDAFARVVTAAFSQRRKTLRNALSALLAEDAIRAAGVDPGARAETLDAAAFVRLALLLPAGGEGTRSA